MNKETTPPTQDEKRDELRQKIEASERRIAERSFADQAREAADKAVDYTRANPLTVVGGAVVVGLVIGLLTRPGRRVASRAAVGVAGAAGGAAHAVGDAAGAAADAARDAGSTAKRRTSHLGSLIADTIAAYSVKLMDEAAEGARAGQDKLEDIGDAASTKARQLRRDAAYYADSTADKGMTAGRRTRRRAERAMRDLTERTRG